jgi:uracil-DNA glycosylase
LAVPGEGPVNAKFMFVGEAPGREENLSGLPFIGRSGKFLTKLIESARLKRERCFISSIIKHRPPKNRKPKKEEISICFPYLENQIKIIKPEIIVLLGQTAFSAFFPKKTLKNFRGKFVTLRRAQGDKKITADFFITYHPAAGIRFVKMKKILEKDFKKLRGV